MTDDAAPKNPYIDRGLVLTETEYNMLAQGLMTLGDIAEQKGDPRFKNRCIKLIVRLKQVEHAGDGMSPEIGERYGSRIARAMAAADPEAIRRGVADLLAASLRLEPDPAERIGATLAELVRTSAQEMSRQLCAQWFDELADVLRDTAQQWSVHQWNGTPMEVASWVIDLLALGRENVAAGHAPGFSDTAEPEPAPSVAPDEPQATP